MINTPPDFINETFYLLTISDREREVIRAALLQDTAEIAYRLAELEQTVRHAVEDGSLQLHLLRDRSQQRYLYVELNGTWLIAPCEYCH